jgi:hypothetical protein
MAEQIFNEHVERISFYEMELYAIVRGEADEQIWIAVKPVCEYLGITIANQREVIRHHPTLAGRWSDITLPSAGGTQKTFCLQLRWVYFWLAGINPRKVKFERQDRLVLYHNECADVLYQHFHLTPRGRAITAETIPLALIQPLEETPELELVPPGDLDQPDVDSFTERVWGPDVDEMIRAESSNKYAALERLITDLDRLAALKESSRRWELTGFAQPVQIEPRRLHYPEDHDDTQDGPMVRCPCYKPTAPPRRHAKSPTECEIHQPPMGLFHLAAHVRGEHAMRFERFCLFCRAGDS